MLYADNFTEVCNPQARVRYSGSSIAGAD